MKRSFVLLLGPAGLVVVATALATAGACKGMATGGGAGAVRSGDAGRASRAPGVAAGETRLARAPSPLPSDFEQRRAAWIKQQPGESDKTMTSQRRRRIEVSRFELAALAQDAAAAAMGMGDDEKQKLSRALTDYRDAVILSIELAAGGGGDEQGGIAPGSSDKVYQDRRRELLGAQRADELARREQQERDKLITERRAYRQNAQVPARGQPRGW